MQETALELLHDIAYIELCLSSASSSHPCKAIIDSQGCDELSNFQVPEPWNGHIDRAPLLYISSNPSISDVEYYPRREWSDELIGDFFLNRFGGGIKEWVRDGNSELTVEGKYLSPTPYWSEIKNRSAELFGRSAVPGKDYALTEIVHCKSRKTIGVDEAIDECGSRYLQRVLKLSGAYVLVTVGHKVGDLIRAALGADQASKIVGPIWMAGQERLVLFFAAPGSNQPRKVDRILTPSEVSLVRSYLTKPRS